MRRLRADEFQVARPLLAVGIGFGALYFVGFAACRQVDNFFIDMCGNSEVRTVASLDGTLKVGEFLRDCGVGSEPSRQFSLLAISESLPNEFGNAFICDTAGQWDPAVRYSPAKVKWLDDHRVEIAYPESLEVFDQQSTVLVPISWLHKVPIQIKLRPLPTLSREGIDKGEGKMTDR